MEKENIDIKFPFEPNEKIKAAFRHDQQARMAIELIMDALLKTSSKMINPWAVARKECPQLKEITKNSKLRLIYNYLSEMIDIETND